VLGANEVQELLRQHGLDARKSLGQNFVADPNTVVRIARLAAVGPGDRVVEVGPGLGSLTLALADTGAQVLALEKDRSLVPVLEEVLASRQVHDVRVVTADALEVDWSTVLGDDGPWTLVANLPYNVAVPIVMSVLEQASAVQHLVVMVQKEVAERLVAGPGGRTVGIPSIRVAWYASAEMLGTVPPEVFVPRPRVTSALVGMTRRPPPSTEVGADEVFRLVGVAYRQRRKMLRSTLGSRVSAEAFDLAGIAPTARPEELSVQDWAALALSARTC
jgi:16S rRNA (adenine1518-N6/adenine1519-N6)-dimethyltransferase